MITVYIASPYTIGDVAINVRNAFLAADVLAENGFVPFTPLASHFWHFLSPHPYNFWAEMDMEWVLRCDCLLRLPGESSGADEEVILARANNIPVFFSIKELLEDGDYIRERLAGSTYYTSRQYTCRDGEQRCVMQYKHGPVQRCTLPDGHPGPHLTVLDKVF